MTGPFYVCNFIGTKKKLNIKSNYIDFINLKFMERKYYYILVLEDLYRYYSQHQTTKNHTSLN